MLYTKAPISSKGGDTVLIDLLKCQLSRLVMLFSHYQKRRYIMSSRTAILLFLGLVTALTLLSCNKAPEKQSEVASSAELSGDLYMDIHRNVDGLTAEAVTGAHQKDLEIQEKYGVNYLKYWYDEESGTIFCLVDAPSKEAAEKVHIEAHGLAAAEIIKVTEGQ